MRQEGDQASDYAQEQQAKDNFAGVGVREVIAVTNRTDEVF
jgi:hypothetical protein